VHEYSIVQALLDQCEETARQNNATKVIKIVVKIGVMSGIEIELLKTAFDTFKEETMCATAKLIINRQPIIVRCCNCLEESILKKEEYSCPKCQSTELNVIDGEDMYLMQLELE
jgi:hydrogenase nickel incorporation protein HypA/HybF